MEIDSFSTIEECDFLPHKGRYEYKKVQYMRFPWWLMIGDKTMTEVWTKTKIALTLRNK